MKILIRNISDETKALERAFGLVRKHPNAYEHLPEELRDNKSLVLRILDAKIDIFEQLEAELKKDREIVLKALQKLPLRRNDSIFIAKAVAIEPLFFHFAGPSVAKCDQVYFVDLIKKYPMVTLFANLDIEESLNYKVAKAKAAALESSQISPSLSHWRGSINLKKLKK